MIDTSDIRALALAVIQSAILDASLDLPHPDAIAFLTDTTGRWAAAFEVWCYAAGIETEWARTKCQETIMRRVKIRQATIEKARIDEGNRRSLVVQHRPTSRKPAEILIYPHQEA